MQVKYMLIDILMNKKIKINFQSFNNKPIDSTIDRDMALKGDMFSFQIFTKNLILALNSKYTMRFSTYSPFLFQNFIKKERKATPIIINRHFFM